MPNERGQVYRDFVNVTATFPSGSPTSSPVSFRGYAMGMAQIASGFTGFWLGAQVSLPGGPYLPLPGRNNTYGDTDVATQLATAQASTAFLVALPPYFFAAESVCLWSHDGSGSGMPQTSARQVVVGLKS
jgi:hypothetical protein